MRGLVGLLALLVCGSVTHGQSFVRYVGQPIIIKVGVNDQGETNHAQIVVFKDGVIDFLETVNDGIHVNKEVPGHTVWSVDTEGQYLVNANGQLTIFRVEKYKGTDPPDPPPPDDDDDDPDIPSDKFDNLGRRIYVYVKGLTLNDKLAVVFRTTATRFTSGGSESVTKIFEDFNDQMRVVLSGNSSYNAFKDRYWENLDKYWKLSGPSGMSREDLELFFNAIANGLEAAS